MINPLIVQEVFDQPLCIDDSYKMSIAMAIGSTFFAHAHGHDTGALQLQVAVSNYVEAYAISPESAAKQSKDYKPGSIGVVSIDGPILENSDERYGVMGTLQAAQAFQLHDADPNVLAHLMFMNSGGGAAYAIKPFRDVIKARTKPLVVFSNKILASAAYGLAADADYIVMYHPHGVVGSLGTMSSSKDMQPMFEKWGMKFSEFYATASKLKNKTYRDARNGDPKALIENVLNPMNETYLSDIRADRGDRISKTEPAIYQGETFTATRAVELGLIDAIGTMNVALSKAVELGSTGASIITQTPNSNMKFPKMLALVGVQAATQEQLDAVNAELAEAGITGVAMFNESVVNEAAEVTKKRDELQASLETANAALTTATSQVTSLTKEVGTLKAKVAAAPHAAAPVVPGADPVVEPTKAQEEAATMASFGHNQYVEQFFGGR